MTQLMSTPLERLDELTKLYPNDRIELSADGMIEITMSPMIEHQESVAKIQRWLSRLLEHDNAVRVYPGVDLQVGTALRIPDVVVLRKGAVYVKGRRWQPSDIVALVVEVASPSTEAVDLGEKRDEYAAAGIDYYWLVSADLRVTMHKLGRDGKYSHHDAVTLRLDDLLAMSSAPPGILLA